MKVRNWPEDKEKFDAFIQGKEKIFVDKVTFSLIEQSLSDKDKAHYAEFGYHKEDNKDAIFYNKVLIIRE